MPLSQDKSRLELWDEAANVLQRAEQQNGKFWGGRSFRLGCVVFLIRESDPLCGEDLGFLEGVSE